MFSGFTDALASLSESPFTAIPFVVAFLGLAMRAKASASRRAWVLTAFVIGFLAASLVVGVGLVGFFPERWPERANQLGLLLIALGLLLPMTPSRELREGPRWFLLTMSALVGAGMGLAPTQAWLSRVWAQPTNFGSYGVFGGLSLVVILSLLPMIWIAGASRWRSGRSLASVLAMALGAGSLFAFGASFRAPPVKLEVEAENEVFFDAPMPHVVIFERGKVVAIRAASTDLASDIIGYNGHVPLSVTLSIKGELLEVALLEGHIETPSYYRRVAQSPLVSQLEGKQLDEPLELGQDVDNVTHATITTVAILEATKKTGRRIATELFPSHGTALRGLQVDEGPKQPFFVNAWVLLFLPLFGLALWIDRFSDGRARRLGGAALQAASVVILGLWLQAFFSIQHGLFLIESVPALVQGQNPLPSLRPHARWTLLVLGALATSWVFGRIYCTYLCPFGALSALLARISPLRFLIPYEQERRLWPIKTTIFFTLLFLLAVRADPDLLLFEPFGDTFSLGFADATSGALARGLWLLTLLLGSLLFARVFCRFLCPAGAMMAFLAKHRIWVKYRPGKCTNCGECMSRCARRGEGRGERGEEGAEAPELSS